MAASGPKVTLTFAGDDRSLSRTLAGLTGRTEKAEASIRSFGAASALAVPALGYVAGAGVALSGVLGMLPSVAFAGGLALGALAIGTQGFGDALSSMDDPAKFAEAIAKLSPAARDTALAVRDLKPQFDGLRKSVQETLFSGVAGELRSLTGALLPTLNTQLGLAAGSFNRTALGFMQWLRMPGTVTDLNTALGGSNAFLDGMLRSLLPVSKAFLDMGVVAAPYMRQLGDAIAGGAARFGEFIGHARASGQLGTWMEAGKQAFLSIWETIKNLGATVRDLGIAFGPVLLGALQGVSAAFAGIAGFIRENAAVMVPLIVGVGLLVAAFKVAMVITGIVNAIRNATVLWTAAQWLLNSAFLANPITWVVIAIAALVGAIIYAWNNCEGFRNVVLAVWEGIKSAFSGGVNWVKSALAWFGSLPGLFSGWFGAAKDWAIRKFVELVTWAAGLPGRVFGALAALAGLAGRAGAWFGGMVSAGVAKAGELVRWMAGLPGRVVGALGNLGGLLLGSGRALVNGFLNGLRGAWGQVLSWARQAMASLRAFWPFSPAKEGAFSGSGYVTHSGRAIAADFAASLASGQGLVGDAARRLMSSAALPFAGLGPSVDHGSVSPATWEALKASGWRGRAGDGREALYRPAAAPVNVYVQGSIRSDRDLVAIIRDEMDRGGFRGVGSSR